MPYALLADLTLLLHGAFILFVVLGGVLVFKWRGAVWLHLPCAFWGALIEFKGWICPLTYLENDLRTRAGAGGYRGGYIDHYLMPLIYPQGLTSDVQITLGVAVVVINVIIYTLVWHNMRTGRG